MSRYSVSADMGEIMRTLHREGVGLTPREIADWTMTPLPRVRKALKELALEGAVKENANGYWWLEK